MKVQKRDQFRAGLPRIHPIHPHPPSTDRSLYIHIHPNHRTPYPSSMQRRCQSLAMAIKDVRNELRSTCNDPDYRKISKIVNQLNSDFYTFLYASKAGNLSKLRQSTRHVYHIPTTPSTRFVVTIPENQS